MIKYFTKTVTLKINFTALIIASMTILTAPAQESPPPKKEENKPLLRFLCVRSLIENDTVILASKTEEGEWKEHKKITLRSPFISDWIEAPHGELHLAKIKNDTIVSLTSFTIPPKMKRAIIVLNARPKKKSYVSNLVDPTQLGFRKGKALVMNFSKIPTVVKTGGKSIKLVKPGQKAILPITAGKDRMYRMLVGYKNKSNGFTACYDRYVSANPKSRKFILVFPDPDTKLRIISLSEFGPFE